MIILEILGAGLLLFWIVDLIGLIRIHIVCAYVDSESISRTQTRNEGKCRGIIKVSNGCVFTTGCTDPDCSHYGHSR